MMKCCDKSAIITWPAATALLQASDDKLHELVCLHPRRNINIDNGKTFMSKMTLECVI